MKKTVHKHIISIGHALDGLKWSWTTQPNYRLHTGVALVVILMGLFYNISVIEWMFVIFTISLGLVIETINTAIEATADAITREWKQEIKIAKDASAAAMLTYAVGAALTGAIIFIPKML